MAGQRVARLVTRMAGHRGAEDPGGTPEGVAQVDELFRAVLRRVAGQPVFSTNLDLTMGQFRLQAGLRAVLDASKPESEPPRP